MALSPALTGFGGVVWGEGGAEAEEESGGQRMAGEGMAKGEQGRADEGRGGQRIAEEEGRGGRRMAEEGR